MAVHERANFWPACPEFSGGCRPVRCRQAPLFNPHPSLGKLRERANRLLKNAHLRRSPHPSSLQRTFKYASGRLTNSSAWQDVAPYSSRRHSQDCLPDRQVKSAAGAPVNGISQAQLASACLREVPPCGTKAGAFLISLKKMSLSTGYKGLTHPSFFFIFCLRRMLWRKRNDPIQGAFGSKEDRCQT